MKHLTRISASVLFVALLAFWIFIWAPSLRPSTRLFAPISIPEQQYGPSLAQILDQCRKQTFGIIAEGMDDEEKMKLDFNVWQGSAVALMHQNRVVIISTTHLTITNTMSARADRSFSHAIKLLGIEKKWNVPNLKLRYILTDYRGTTFNCTLASANLSTDIATFNLESGAELAPETITTGDIVEPKQNEPLIFCSSNKIRMGKRGNPLSEIENLLTFVRNIYETDAALEPGFSGGPVFTRTLNLTGISLMKSVEPGNASYFSQASSLRSALN